MLTWIRDATQTFFFKLLIATIAITFVGSAFLLWGEAGPGGPNLVAVVGDEEITVADYRRALRQVDDAIKSQFGGQIDPAALERFGVGKMAMASLVDTALQRQAAHEAGVIVTDAEVADAVMAVPEFRKEGVFDAKRYAELLALNGLTPATFEAGMRTDLLMRRLRTLVERTAVVTDQEIYAAYVYANQPVTVAYATVAVDPIKRKLAPADAEVAEWFTAHRGDFEVPEKRSFRLLNLTADAVTDSVTVTDEEAREYYEKNIAVFASQASVSARHILIQMSPSATDAEKEAAKKKIDAAAARVAAGEDFATVAKEMSEGPSGPAGGDLGSFGRGAMVPEFEQVAFSLAKGRVSEPFTTPFGWHIVKVDDTTDESAPSFEEARPAVEATLKQQNALRTARERMEGVAATVTPDKFAAVTDTNPEIRINSYTIDAEGALPAADLSTDARAIVFDLDEREISAVLSTDDGYAVALLDAIEPPHTPELEAIRPVVTATYVAAKAKDEAERIAAEIERAVNEGTTLAEAAAAHGVAVETTRPFSRNDLSKGTATGEGMIAEAFELADFEARTASTGKGVMVYTVTSRENVDMAAYATDAPTLAANLLQDKKARVYAAYVQNLRKEAETAGIIQIKKDL